MAEFQIDHEARDGRQFAAGAELCRPELLLPGQLELARRAFEKFRDGLSTLLSGYSCTPAEIRFAGADQQPVARAVGFQVRSWPATRDPSRDSPQ